MLFALVHPWQFISYERKDIEEHLQVCVLLLCIKIVLQFQDIGIHFIHSRISRIHENANFLFAESRTFWSSNPSTISSRSADTKSSNERSCGHICGKEWMGGRILISIVYLFWREWVVTFQCSYDMVVDICSGIYHAWFGFVVVFVPGHVRQINIADCRKLPVTWQK